MKSTIILLLIATLLFKTCTQRKLRFVKLGGKCGNSSHLKAIFVVHRIVEQNFQINGSLNVTEDFPGDAAAEIEVKRCRSVENPNTCEYFHGLRLQRFCRIKLEEFLNYEPPISCPFKKGEYQVSSIETLTRRLNLFPFNDFVWKFNLTITKARDILFCFDFIIKK